MLNNTTKIDKISAYEDIKILMAAIKEIRKFYGLTMQSFAFMCDIPAPTYRILEKSGKGNVVTLYKLFICLADKLSIDLNYLILTHEYPRELFSIKHQAIKKAIQDNKKSKKERQVEKEQANWIL